MSRPWILRITSCLLIASSTSVGWSQEYLDLPDEPVVRRTSLADKLSSLTDKFRRKPSEATQPPVSQGTRTRPGVPRYRNYGQPSMQAQQRARRSNNQRVVNQAPAPQSQQREQTPSPNTTLQPRTTRTPGIVARPNTNDLLPDTRLFSRTNQPRGNSATTGDLSSSSPSSDDQKRTTAATAPRAGSSRSELASPRVARRSPQTSRANELDAALADLLTTQPTTEQKVANAPALKSTSPSKSTKPATKSIVPLADNAFDLRQALRDDEDDAIADETATAANAAMQDEIAPKPPVIAAQVKETTAKPGQKKNATPRASIAKPNVAATKPKPPVVAQTKPVAAPVSGTQATPAPVVAVNPQREAITIAVPRPSPAVTGSATRTVGKDPFESSASQAVGATSPSANPMRPFQPVIEQVEPTQTFARPKSGVLQTTQQPVIVSHVEGPRSILVGREATYQVTLENTSSRAASQISAEITVPEWAELLDAMSTSGVVERSASEVSPGALEWKISELKPHASQALRLRLIPRSGRPLQLGVRWSQAPVQAQAVVEVQEPKLELAISGPQEVRFGKAQRYRLTLRNPGTGTTEKVALRLIPPGGDAKSATTQDIGSLKPGEVKDIDLELTAREAGELLIQADAVADGGLKAETTKTVQCIKPELAVDWRGPDRKYAGTEAAYYFRVSNPGTAATDPVDMSVKLPVGAEFVTASEGYSIDTATGLISWSLAGLEAGEEQFMQLRCKIGRPGTNEFLVSAATNESELTDSKAFQTEVVALADLKLEVSDPQGPLPLADEVAYEIRVRNRGTTGAEHINIVGLFSEGIDPTTVEGAQYSVRDGRVSFHPIKSLSAGQEVVLRIRAKASQVGTHIFRAEVTCPKLDIKLAAEETTRFFEEEHRWEDGETPYMAERESTTLR